jgi:hypothetical protein
MKFVIEIEANEVESMSKTATTIVETVIKGRSEVAKLVVESVDRTVATLCSRIDKIMESETARAAARKVEAEVELKEMEKEEIVEKASEKVAKAFTDGLRSAQHIHEKYSRSKDDDDDDK